MNCVGIDVSKGKSMIAVMRPFGEVVVSPFEVLHTDSELSELARLLKSLDGETRVVMEATGRDYKSALQLLLYISYFLHLNCFIKKAAPKPEKETTVFIRHNIQQYFLHT